MSASLYVSEDPTAGFIRLPEALEVNMSNANARVVLAALGFNPDFDGSENNDGGLEPVQVREMWAACVRFQTSPDAAAVMDGGMKVVHNGRVMDCGRRPGYITERVGQMRAALEYSMEHGAKVAYFV